MVVVEEQLVCVRVNIRIQRQLHCIILIHHFRPITTYSGQGVASRPDSGFVNIASAHFVFTARKYMVWCAPPAVI